MTFPPVITSNNFNTIPADVMENDGSIDTGINIDQTVAQLRVSTFRFPGIGRWLRYLRLCGLSVVLLGLLWLSTGAYAEGDAPMAAGSIGGRVTNEQGEPIPARVFLYRYPFERANPTALAPNPVDSLWVDNSGIYTFTGLTVGVYRVGFSDVSDLIRIVIPDSFNADLLTPVYAYQFYSDSARFGASPELTVMGNTLTNIDAVLHPVSVITGTVTLTTTMATRVDLMVLLLQPADQVWQFVRGELVEDVTVLPHQTSQVAFQVGRLPAGTFRLCAMAFAGVNADDALAQDVEWAGCYGGAGNAALDPLTDLPVQEASDLALSAGITTDNLNFIVTHLALRLLPDVPGIGGRVTADDGQPLTGILVRAYHDDSPSDSVPPFPAPKWVESVYTYTNANGEYLLPLRLSGEYALDFHSSYTRYWPGDYMPELYADAATLAEVTPLYWEVGQKLRQLDVSLSMMPQITGRAPLTQFEHLAAPILVAYQQSGDGWQVVHQLDLSHSNAGRFSFPERFDERSGDYVMQLPPGTYRIAVSAMLGSSLAPQPINAYYGGPTLETASDLQLEANQIRRDINIRLGEGDFEGVIEGQVTGGSIPQAGVQVELYHSGSTQPSLFVTTDSSGHYSMTALLNGVYWVRALSVREDYLSTFYGGYTVSFGAKAIPVVGSSPVTGINIDLATQPSHLLFLPAVSK